MTTPSVTCNIDNERQQTAINRETKMKFQTQIITEQIEYKTNGTGLIENERLVEWLRYVDEDGYADDLVDKMVELGFDAAVDWLTYEWIGDPATAEMIVDFFTR